MIQLLDVNDQNWLDVAALRVSESQKMFLDRTTGILARGYAYRSCNARVIGIANDEQMIGVALVKNLDEEPACYDLQQFMIDQRFQNKGYGTEALRLILTQLRKEGRYARVEVCVNKEDMPALKMYRKLGFSDTGYIDESCPDCLNLVYAFPTGNLNYTDTLISDFSAPLFRNAFRQYFSELGINVTDWNSLFKEMNDEGDNLAFVRTTQDGTGIGFIQFKPITFTSWFFEETCGFIREFWVSENYWNAGHGTALIRLAEGYFYDHGLYTSILTSDTAERFYLRHSYHKRPGCKAKNGDDVFMKRLK